MTTLACSQMRMRLPEALVAITFNAAQALQEENHFGTLEIGKKFHPWRVALPSYEALAYQYGEGFLH
jgi:hypothetical protein